MSKTKSGKKTTVITNQYTPPDPRQEAFLLAFLSPDSPTYSNCLQSGLAVGYSQEYSENLMSRMPKWLSETVEDNSLLNRAIRNLSNTLDLKTEVQAMGAFGPIFEKRVKLEKVTLKNGKTKNKKVIEKVPIMVENAKLLKIKTDVSTFVAETVGRARFSSQKGNNFNGPVQFNFSADREKYS